MQLELHIFGIDMKQHFLQLYYCPNLITFRQYFRQRVQLVLNFMVMQFSVEAVSNDFSCISVSSLTSI